MNIISLPNLLFDLEKLRSDIIISPELINKEDLLIRLDSIINKAKFQQQNRPSEK